MARTVHAHFLPGVPAQVARATVLGWLQSHRFRILTPESDGTTAQYRAPEALQPGNPGAAVLNIDSAPGSIVAINTSYDPRAPGWPLIFVVHLDPQTAQGRTGTTITAGFLFPTFAGIPSLGVREWTVTNTKWGVGGIVRVRAWPVVEQFDFDFGHGLLPAVPPFVPPPPFPLPSAGVVPVTPTAGNSGAGSLGSGTIAAQVGRTSAIHTAGLLAQVATSLYTFITVILLFVAIGVSGITIYAVLLGPSPPLFYVLGVGIVGGTILLGYSVYFAQRKIYRSLLRGELDGVAPRALYLGIGSMVLGGTLGYAFRPNPIPYIWVVAGILYLVLWNRLRSTPPGPSPVPA